MKTILSIFIVSLLSLPTLFGQSRSGQHVTITDPFDEDLYVSGNTISENAPVSGDLIVAGREVIVEDSIMQDVIAAGGIVWLFNGSEKSVGRSAGDTFSS
ncbi:hypothetical protein QQ008_21195 [Fulvivirgaceae bacterium BMA10]|uniref:Uncharacterized protein n=1 Tax=Splendidivirga corallicola TaxID=3051826 RepID=A0ABT8KT36_9BACT|nr:hypothetical protein [Fulvivirgaceae bacterium BMA10]